MKSFTKFLGLAAFALLATCTDENGNPVDPVKQLCGFTCPGDKVDGVKIGGVADGNASITGVAKVDAFFAATINFQSAANDVSNGIQDQLNLIKADFGITEGSLADGLEKQFQANLQAGVKYEYQPARCAIDAQATLEASAKCDAEVSGGTATVECKGSCAAEVTAEAKCDVDADLYCTVSGPEIDCQGECQGSCTAELTAEAKCDGTCRGTCSGNCSAYSDSGATQCAGTCEGMCKGSCEAKLAAAAKCEGKCHGECTAKPPTAGCEGAVRAECRAHANATFECKGKCTGDFEPPKVEADCSATAKAQASVNVQCSPPRLGVTYAFKLDADPKFKSALTTLLDVRLPALLQATGKAKIVATAGDGLRVAANGAVKSSVDTLKSKTSFKVKYGLLCAADQLDDAEDMISQATDTLSDRMMDAKAVSAKVGLSTI